MTREEVKNRIYAIMRSSVDFNGDEIPENASMYDHLGLDSLDEFILMVEVEKEFGIHIPDNEIILEDMNFGEFVDVIHKVVAKE